LRTRPSVLRPTASSTSRNAPIKAGKRPAGRETKKQG
jgi:hypothetical protein